MSNLNQDLYEEQPTQVQDPEVFDPNNMPAGVVPDAPHPDMLSEVRLYYSLLQQDYRSRMSEIEKFLNFAEGAEAIGTRLHNVEKFLGIKVG